MNFFHSFAFRDKRSRNLATYPWTAFDVLFFIVRSNDDTAYRKKRRKKKNCKSEIKVQTTIFAQGFQLEQYFFC